MNPRQQTSPEPLSGRTVLDLRGGGCAWCILKIKSLLKEMRPGQTLEVLVTDPGMVEDLTAVLAAGRDRLVKSAQERGFRRIYLLKN